MVIRDSRMRQTKLETEVFYYDPVLCPQPVNNFHRRKLSGLQGHRNGQLCLPPSERNENPCWSLSSPEVSNFSEMNICSVCIYVHAHVCVQFVLKISREEEMMCSRNLFKDEMALLSLIQTNLCVTARGYYLSRREEKEVRNSSHSLSEQQQRKQRKYQESYSLPLNPGTRENINLKQNGFILLLLSISFISKEIQQNS